MSVVDCGTDAYAGLGTFILAASIDSTQCLRGPHTSFTTTLLVMWERHHRTDLGCGHHRGVLRLVHRLSDMLLSPSSCSRLLPFALLSVLLTSVTPLQTLIPAFPEGCPYIAENCTRLELLPVQRTDSCHQNIAAGFAQEVAAADDAQVCHCCIAFLCHCCIAFLCHCSAYQPLRSPIIVSETSWSSLRCRVSTWSFMVRYTESRSLSKYFLLDSAFTRSVQSFLLADESYHVLLCITHWLHHQAELGLLSTFPCSPCLSMTTHSSHIVL